MDERIPDSIREFLLNYLSMLQDRLPTLVSGFYLHGSIALGAFDERFSDIDFVAFTNRRLDPAEVEQLAAIHRAIATSYPRWGLEGSYLQWDELGLLEENIAPSPSYHDGNFAADRTFDANLVTWWILKNHGIALIGPQPQSLAFTVDWDLLEARMKENLNTYWVRFVTRPRAIASLLSDYGIQWTVLGVLRQYYTFVAHDITSKRRAGEYALDHLPSQWHLIIHEALRLRRGEPDSFYKSRLVRAADAYNFLKYIIHYCNSLSV